MGGFFGQALTYLFFGSMAVLFVMNAKNAGSLEKITFGGIATETKLLSGSGYKGAGK